MLIQNLLAYLLPDAVAKATDADCGQRVALTLDARDVSAAVRAPSGRTVPLSGGVLSDTDEIGLYTLEEEREDGSRRETAFALHIPFAESDVQTVAASRGGARADAASNATGREWTTLVLLLAFVLLLLEWEASRRGA